MAIESVVSSQMTAKLYSGNNKQKLQPGRKANYSVKDILNLPKGAYVPPHMRQKTKIDDRSKDQKSNNNGVKKFENKPAQKNFENASNKNNKNGNNWRREKSWRSSSSSSSNSDNDGAHSNFQAWKNQKEEKKQKKVEEKAQAKPHNEVLLTDLPPQMRSVANLATFFHPYGEVAQIQLISPSDEIPENVSKFIGDAKLSTGYAAVVEFLTARVAKFVVGVLRKRLTQLNFRVGLLKPGLAEELVIQKNTIGETTHAPACVIFDNQKYTVKTMFSDSSSDTSEIDQRPSKRNIKRIYTTRASDQAYWTGSSSSPSNSSTNISSSSSGHSDSDSDRRTGSPVSSIPEEDESAFLAEEISYVKLA